MIKYMTGIVVAALLLAAPALAQNPPAAPPAPPQNPPPAAPAGPPQRGRAQAPPPGPGRSNNPFPAPISATEGVITVNFVEFASLPDAPTAATATQPAGTQPARMNLLIDEPGTRRMFVNTMQGMLYSVSYDGKVVAPYLDVNDPKWSHPVQFQGSERGLQSFAFHPQFARAGTPGFGKFYTYLDTTDMTPKADFVPLGNGHTHDEILLEWTARNPKAAAYDGGLPRELFRVAHPFANHNGGQIAFNPLAQSGTSAFGLLYIGSADGGSGGDPYNASQNLSSIFGKILRIDPLGKNSANGKYGIPSSNPFIKTPDALGEIYTYGHRNPQRFSWDPKDGRMFEAEIGQNINEEINQITAGGNYGWNVWEGSFKYFTREVSVEEQRGDPKMMFPVVEFDHTDPLFLPSGVAATGVYVYRASTIKALTGMLIFGDNPSGEIFYVKADGLPKGGQLFRRILFNDKGETKTLLQLIKEKNTQQGKPVATRADLRMGMGPNGQLFVLNKRDGVIRLLVK